MQFGTTCHGKMWTISQCAGVIRDEAKEALGKKVEKQVAESDIGIQKSYVP